MRRGVEWRKIGWGKVPNMNPVNNTRRELNEVLKNKKCNEFCGMKREFDKIKEEARREKRMWLSWGGWIMKSYWPWPGKGKG